MDATKYFKIVSVSDHVLHLERSDEVAKQFGNTMVSEFRKAAREASSEGPFVVLADLRELEVLSRQGRVILSRVMDCAKTHGMYKAVEVVPNPITRLSIREAAELTGTPDFRVPVNTFEEALTMVETLKKEMLKMAEEASTSLATPQ